ncbi:hypothetical protein CLV79_104269 [Limimaricola soesokkakensis]|uniref:Uncharacterized protein n=2 Tax=Limimaricola soesokkakensis TaxID=1343159 RepID=A0A1X6Z5K4_9RHOB|nr:hypothetical protein CLV79_104269 [Limimaricola soesokkakensis]SLN40875.1 hypothetical protein LOS8367_01683 [Limimaricola soesokkakensis]
MTPEMNMTFKTTATALALALGCAAAPALAQTSGQTLPGMPDLSTLPTSGGGQQLPGLVSVNLENIRAEIAKDLDIDLQNVPITIQLPVAVAANVCGVDVGALGGGQLGSDTPECSATNTTIATQYVTNSQTAAGDTASAPTEQPVGNATDADRSDTTTEGPVAPQPPGLDAGGEAPDAEAPVTDLAPSDQAEASTASEDATTGADASTETEGSSEADASGETAASGDADAQTDTTTAN